LLIILKAKPLTKKGAARLSAATVIEKLGDPNHPETFLTIDSNEQKLGAYVGFNNVSHFRLLILSWPVLKAYLAFEPISKGMNRKTAFRLLHDDEEQFIAVNAEEKWPIVDTDSRPYKQISCTVTLPAFFCRWKQISEHFVRRTSYTIEKISWTT
jgi:hypothetical protein